MKTKTLWMTLAAVALGAVSVRAQVTVSTDLTNGLAEPFGIVADLDNTFYITDSIHNRVMRVDPNSSASTPLAGLIGLAAGSENGPSYLARFNKPEGIALAKIAGVSGVVVADAGNHTIRFITISNGSVATLAGRAGIPGLATNAAGTSATFNSPVGLAVDGNNRLYVADSKNNVIRQINLNDPLFNVTTFSVTNTTFREPASIAVKGTNELWVADTGNNTIKLVLRTSATTGSMTTYMGSNSRVVTGTADNGYGPYARFNSPRGLFWLGNSGLLIADSGNHTLRLATNNPVIAPNNWAVFTYAGTPGVSGFTDGAAAGVARFNSPTAIARDNFGGGFVLTDLKNNAIRRIQNGAPQPPVASPQIGWVDFVFDSTIGTFVSSLRTDSPFVFNNDVVIAILGEQATETFFTFGPTPQPPDDTVPTPGRLTGNTPQVYRNGIPQSSFSVPSIITAQPDVTVKAIGVQDGRRSSAITSSRFQFKAANPVVQGDNAAYFTVTCATSGAEMWYTIDGSDPTNVPSANNFGPITSPAVLNLDASVNGFTFKIRAFRANYATSAVSSRAFTPDGFIPNRITFGFESGEASSDFVASPGQLFYSPVTLSILPGTKMYSLQFNVTVTNRPGAPVMDPNSILFLSTLVKPRTDGSGLYVIIPPALFDDGITNIVGLVTNYFPNINPPPVTSLIYPFSPLQAFLDMRFVDTANNLIGVGWFERFSRKNLYDTTAQDLIKYSLPHDTLFDELGGRIVLGGYAFRVPCGATPGSQYKIQIGRPSATSDGVGAPGSDVFIATPTGGSLTIGRVNAIKYVTAGQRKYVAGDVAPFRWFNAGDFGGDGLLNQDVMQVFQSARYRLNEPLAGSDFFDGMDSCCGTYVNNGNGYLEQAGGLAGAAQNILFDGTDATIDSIAFGDGELDVSDIFVTYRRSLDPSRVWFQRYWTNCVRVAQFTTNAIRSTSTPDLEGQVFEADTGGAVVNIADEPAIQFRADDATAAAGQVIQIPIRANIRGAYPLRVMMLGLMVEPLDGSPALTDAVQFTPNSGLGSPFTSSSRSAGDYSAVWLNRGIAGLSGNTIVGTLTVRIPAGASSSAAYAIRFEHVSASPNGLGKFPKQTLDGLITLSARTTSSLNDGIPDSWRLRYFGTANNLLSHAGADADGDGVSNWAEYKAGTNPNDASSVLRVHPRSNFVIHWPSALGKSYIIERAATLGSPSWTQVGTATGTGWEMDFQDSPGGGNRFYRVRIAE